MSDSTRIEWTDGGATWNIVNGCSIRSEGCSHCYAMTLAGTRLKHHPSRKGLTKETKSGPVWTGEVRMHRPWLDQPIRWARPRMIFVCAHGDLFHENVPEAWIDEVMAVVAYTDWHIHQILTKRAARLFAYMTRLYRDGRYRKVAALIANIVGGTEADRQKAVAKCIEQFERKLPRAWFGVTAENQVTADERIPYLLAAPVSVRWVSAEPLMSFVDLKRFLPKRRRREDEPKVGSDANPSASLDWVVAGYESGPGARPGHPDWARKLRDDCVSAGTAFFFKQWGAWKPDKQHPKRIFIYHDGSTDVPDARAANPKNEGECEIAHFGKKKSTGRELDGRTWLQFPPEAADLKVA
jgi:protein gp37